MMQENNSEQFTDAEMEELVKYFLNGDFLDTTFVRTLKENLPQDIDFEKTASMFKFLAANNPTTSLALMIENLYYVAFIRGIQYGLEIDPNAPLAQQKDQLIKTKSALKFKKTSNPARARCIEIILSGWEKYAAFSKRDANAFIRKELFEDAISKPYWMSIKFKKSKSDALFRDARKAAEKAKQ